MPANQNTPLKLRYMRRFRYGGISYDFAYLVHRNSGEPLHELCGFALICAITGKHATLNSSISIIEQLKFFFEELVLWNGLDWRNLSDEVILQYLYEYRYKTKELSGSSINLQRHAIQSFYDWAYKYGFIDTPKELDIGFELEGFRDYIDNPDPYTAIESQYISKVDFEKLLANVPGESHYLARRNELALMLGYHCGVRTHELTQTYNFIVKELRAKIEHAKRKGQSSFDLTIYGKGRGKARNILIGPAVFRLLKQFLSDRRLRGQIDDKLPLFLTEQGKPISTSGLGSYVFRKAKASCTDFVGPKWHRISYHSLRHTYATNLATWCAENGYDWRTHVPSRLGHTHYSTSQIYVEVEALMNKRVKILNELKVVVREYYPTDREALRIVQYESCRGLEGWTVINYGFDDFFEHKLRQSLASPSNPDDLFETKDELAQDFAAQWAMIPLTRAMDTLVINLSCRDSIVKKAMLKVAERRKDFVEWMRL